MNIGEFLKKLRKDKNLTLIEVADRNGISISLLSQIENDKASPSLNTLQVLLRFYGIGLSAFFNQVESNDIIVMKKKDAESFVSESEGVRLTFLASKLQQSIMVYFKAEMNPKSELVVAQQDKDIRGERFIYIISGSVEIVINEREKFTIHKEDSIIFKSSLSCKIVNNTTHGVHLVISGTPPLF